MTMQAPAIHIPLSERINIRMIVFGLVVCTLVGYPVYVYLDAVITGGIKDIGGGYKLVNLQAMSSFAFPQETGTLNDIPKQWRDLDGQKLVLYGEMWDAKSADNINVKDFDLCYSIAKCCFSGSPQVQHFVRSRVLPGKSLQEYPNLVKVTGTLHVKIIHDDNQPKIGSIYQLDVENIEPAT